MSVIIKGGGNNVLADVDSMGNLLVSTEGQKATYRSAFNITNPAVGDIAMLTGSATKIVKLTRLILSAATSAASGAYSDIGLIKRSTLNTGGTPTNQSAIPNDSADAAGTAVVRSWTTAPTLGTTVGFAEYWRYLIVNGIAAIPMVINSYYGGVGAKALVLHGAAESLCINIDAIPAVNNSFDIVFEWTEE